MRQNIRRTPQTGQDKDCERSDDQPRLGMLPLFDHAGRSARGTYMNVNDETAKCLSSLRFEISFLED